MKISEISCSYHNTLNFVPLPALEYAFCQTNDTSERNAKSVTGVPEIQKKFIEILEIQVNNQKYKMMAFPSHNQFQIS